MGNGQRCTYCEVVIDSNLNKTTKTEDGHIVCIDCYHKIFNEIFKGQFTYEQGLKALYSIAKYEELLKLYLLEAKKLAKVNNLNHKQMLDKLIEAEEFIAEQSFKMGREALLQDKNKHFEVVKAIYENFGYIVPIVDTRGVSISSSNIDYDVRLLDIAYKQLSNNIVISV